MSSDSAASPPGWQPARSMARTVISSASSFDANCGHQPPSSATPASLPASCISVPAAR